MTARTIIWLAGALAVLGVLVVLGDREPEPANESGGLLVPGLEAILDNVTALEVVGAGGEPIATLERGPDGWSVLEKNGYPADLRKVRHTLLSLAEARILEAKTANSELYDRLGVEAVDADDAGGIAVTLVGAGFPVSIIVGDSSGDYQAYIRRADEAQSYLIDRDPEVGRTAPDWLDTAIVSVDRDRIQRVTVTHADGEVVSVHKTEPGETDYTVEGVPEDRELLYASIANVMGTVLGGLNLEDVESRGDVDEAATVTEYRTFDGLVITTEAFERQDQAWVAFDVAFEAPPTPAEPEDVPGEESSPAADGAAVEAEAQALDSQLSGWRYAIPTYQFEQMTRRMSDLLKALPDA